MMKKIREHSLYIAFAIALAGILGSLYFSEIKGLIPCLLCWYQRIALYPLAIIFAVGIIKKTREAWDYAATFIIVGGLIALFHTLLDHGIIPESASRCIVGVPCAQVSWSLFGFITIPFLSFLAFLALAVLYFMDKKR